MAEIVHLPGYELVFLTISPGHEPKGISQSHQAVLFDRGFGFLRREKVIKRNEQLAKPPAYVEISGKGETVDRVNEKEQGFLKVGLLVAVVDVVDQ